ncbi:MAG: hydroxymethylbilane synthase [Rickettsiales bacterium]
MKIRLGTRKSNLALKQTEIVKAELLQIDPSLLFATQEIITTGDINLESNLYESGGKGLFLKEIEQALLNDEIDIAIHSLKDVPAILPAGLELCAVLRREDPRDVFVSKKYSSIWELPLNAVVGTSSPRRKVQLLQMRPDLTIVNFRGNINTRLDKIERSEVDATVLALAGLKRLSLERNFLAFEVDEMLPAIGQGAICIEKKITNKAFDHLLLQINDAHTQVEVQAERRFMQLFGASCNTPIAAYAQTRGNKLLFKTMYHDPARSKTFYSQQTGYISESLQLAEQAFKLFTH